MAETKKAVVWRTETKLSLYRVPSAYAPFQMRQPAERAHKWQNVVTHVNRPNAEAIDAELAQTVERSQTHQILRLPVSRVTDVELRQRRSLGDELRVVVLEARQRTLDHEGGQGGQLGELEQLQPVA